MISRLDSSSAEFDSDFARLLAQARVGDDERTDQVRAVVEDVRRRGDAALVEYSRRFDGLDCSSAADMAVSPADSERAWHVLAEEERHALQFAAGRIREFASRQLEHDWSFEDEWGNVLGERVLPLDRVGLYVPGGRASYPSSLLMTAVPAQVAGVSELVVVTPATKDRGPSPLVLAVAHMLGLSEVYFFGGAQGVAALAYGTETLKAVDKIAGPGNFWVMTAKRLVAGIVAIESLAGPSEVCIVLDRVEDAHTAALDLCAQAEHDVEARALLIAIGEGVADAVASALTELVPSFERRSIISAALSAHGALIEAPDRQAAARLVDLLAPEHLQLMVAEPEDLWRQIRHAGAVFLGSHSAEAFGDYCAGPSHVLPTGGSARFSSPLRASDFQKHSSVVSLSLRGSRALAPVAARLGESEGLGAHAASARRRLEAGTSPPSRS